LRPVARHGPVAQRLEQGTHKRKSHFCKVLLVVAFQ
jgi:hypothetical protein